MLNSKLALYHPHNIKCFKKQRCEAEWIFPKVFHSVFPTLALWMVWPVCVFVCSFSAALHHFSAQLHNFVAAVAVSRVPIYSGVA